MKLGISTASYFPRYYTEDTFERIATLGADVFELFFQSRSEYTDNYADLGADYAPSSHITIEKITGENTLYTASYLNCNPFNVACWCSARDNCRSELENSF